MTYGNLAYKRDYESAEAKPKTKAKQNIEKLPGRLKAQTALRFPANVKSAAEAIQPGKPGNYTKNHIY